jgi:adenylate kinase family enzyme
LQSGHNFDENQVALIKRIFFNDLSKRKFILGGFPNTFAALEFFEQNCCNIRHLIAFTHKPLDLQGRNLYAQYHTQGRLIKINYHHLEQFDSYVTNRCRYGFLVGPELAGRPAVAAYLKNRYVTQVIDYNAVNELLKVRLSTEDNQVEEVPFPELVKYFKEEIASRDRSHNILFDGWPFEKEQLTAFLRSVGAPNYVFWLDATDETLGKRYMAANQAEAVDEGEQEKINEELAKTKQFIQAFNDCIHEGNNIHLFDIKVGVSHQTTVKEINGIIYKKVFAFKNSSNQVNASDLRSFVVNACINNDVTFIDVADLVNQSATATDENSKKLHAQAVMTNNTLQSLAPSIFTPTLVTDLIAKSLQNHPATKYLLLYNYPSAENKPQGDFYPRAIDELYQIENNIGPLKEVIAVVDAPEDFVINDPVEEKPVVEEVKVEVKAPKGDGEEEEEVPEPPKDEDEDGENKPKFNPLDFNWTVSDGNPKSLAKIYHRRFNCEHDQINVSTQDLTPLENLLRDSIARFDEGENRDKDYYVEVIINQ